MAAKRKWFFRAAAFTVLGVAPDKRTWRELKPLMQNGNRDAWLAELAKLGVATKREPTGVAAPVKPPAPAPAPAPQTATGAPAKPRKPKAAKPSADGTTAPETPSDIMAQLARLSAAAAREAA